MKKLAVWSEQNPDKIKHRIELKPGETIEIEFTWQVPPGEMRGAIVVHGLLYQRSDVAADAITYICVESCDPYH